MTDLFYYPAMSAMALVATGIISVVALKGWRDWIALKREELQQVGALASENEPAAPTAFARIEVADLKERVRKLEAIAAGVDL